ncbi:MAG TPA: hypothetical protein PK566_08845 [Pseudobacteroides sp.]|nr:hypothetical protein [Pseudobacteroides sp.]
MRRWLSTLEYKVNGFMQGRYGYDELSRFLSIAGIIMILISYLPYIRFLNIIGFVLLVWSLGRALSRNFYKRQMERNRYLSIKNKTTQRFRLYKSMWRDRKTHKYYNCPGCKADIRIKKPERGRRIMITCPKCKQSFEKRT